jgi:hypothetical protein
LDLADGALTGSNANRTVFEISGFNGQDDL